MLQNVKNLMKVEITGDLQHKTYDIQISYGIFCQPPHCSQHLIAVQQVFLENRKTS